jgi:hypothetical protein
MQRAQLIAAAAPLVAAHAILPRLPLELYRTLQRPPPLQLQHKVSAAAAPQAPFTAPQALWRHRLSQTPPLLLLLLLLLLLRTRP